MAPRRLGHGSLSRRGAARGSPGLQRSHSEKDGGMERRDACELGAWKCVGQDLQRCFDDKWNVVQTCDGAQYICAANRPGVPPGCVNAPAGAFEAPINDLGSTPTSASAVIPPPEGSSLSVLPGNHRVLLVGESSTAVSALGPSPTALSPSSDASAGPGSVTTSATSVDAAGSTSGSAPVVTGGSGGGNFPAPHWAMYADRVHDPETMPKAADILPVNRWILAFWLAKCPDTGAPGPYDWAKKWLAMPDAEKDAVLKDYHDNGIALMVSAFGSTDAPTTTGEDPEALAKALASFVIGAKLDGVDIDYEDTGAFVTGTGEAWLIKFQTALRAALPAPYIIAHAPQPVYFAPGQLYPQGGYAAVHKAVGSGIDFYMIQYYNQGNQGYTECSALIESAAGTSLLEVSASAGVPLDKLVIGKPLNSKWVMNSGLMEPAALATCVQQGKAKGWNGGVMFWQWDEGGQAAMKAVAG